MLLLDSNLRRSQTSVWFAPLLLFLAAIGCSAQSKDVTTNPANSVVQPRAFIASAPDGFSVKHLGTPHDANFERLSGRDGRTLFEKADTPTKDPGAAKIDHKFVDTSDKFGFEASLTVWNIFQAGGGYSSGRQHIVWRAVQIESVYEIDDTTRMRRAPDGAIYYPWRVYMGWSYEALFSGSQQDMHAGIKAEIKSDISGKLGGFANSHNLDLKVRGKGLRPKNGQAIFADSVGAVKQNYSADGPAVPILVEWRRLPGLAAPVRQGPKKNCAGNQGCEPCKLWRFNRLEYNVPAGKPNGYDWDSDGSPPDVTIQIRADGQIVARTPKREALRITHQFRPPLELRIGQTIKVTAIDSDLIANDLIQSASERVGEFLARGRLSLAGGSIVLRGVCADPR